MEQNVGINLHFSAASKIIFENLIDDISILDIEG